MLITKKNFKTENIYKKDIERLLNKKWIIFIFLHYFLFWIIIKFYILLFLFILVLKINL